MRIKEIELDNFKSFGKATTISLMDGFTTISGPNGSGKSNVIDSLLFALGLSSTRSMRAERLPDLLNNLSKRNDAKVRVVFADDNDNQIEVTRKIKVKESSYSSTYSLNGKNATLTEIHDELSKFNISPTGFNVIMQGDVTNIVTMSPTERRKIIDELSGVAEFDRKIDLAKQELDEVCEHTSNQKIIQAEILSRLESLEEDKEHALKYLKYKQEKENAEQELVFAKAKDLRSNLTQTQETLSKLELEEAQANISLKDNDVQMLELRTKLSELEQLIKQKGGLEQLAIRQELENKTGELTRINNKLSHLLTLQEEKNKALKNLEKEIKINEKKQSENSKQKKSEILNKEELELKIFEIQGSLSAISAEIEVLRQAKDKGFSEITQIHLDLTNLLKDKAVAQNEVGNNQNRINNINQKVEETRLQLSQAFDNDNNLKPQLSELLNKKKSFEELVATTSRSINQIEQEINSTHSELENKNYSIDILKRRMIELETKKELVAGSGFGKASDAILNSNIKGVLGTVSQLLTVPPKYQLAIEAAVGGRVNHIVVENDKVASECINYLKSQNLGRATFIPVNKIMGQSPGQLINKPGVIDFAINLVDFDGYLTRVFQYVLGQTIIVEDMDKARPLINLARMVTLDGELFDKSGTITGGFDNKSKGHFGGNLSDDIGQVSEGVTKLNSQIDGLKNALKDLNAELNQEKHNLNEYNLKLNQITAQIDQIQRERQQFADTINRLKPKLQELNQECENLELEFQNSKDRLEFYSQQIVQKESQLEQLSDKSQTSKIEKLIIESKNLNNELADFEQKLRIVEKNISIIETQDLLCVESINKIQLDIDTLNQELTQILQEIPVIQEQIDTTNSIIEDLKQKVTQLSDELESLRLEKENIFEQVTKLEVLKTKLTEKLIAITNHKEECYQSIDTLSEQINELDIQIAEILKINPNFVEPDLAQIDSLRQQIEKLDRKMKSLEPVNMKALEDYEETKLRLDELTNQLAVLEIEKINIMERISSFDELKKNTFLEAYDAINNNFQSIFSELSHGTGRLELEDPDNPFNGGLIIRAQPRDKKMQRIEALSGGEKSLTALSFVFAFQRYAPAPFYAFDEVDMMLDGSNAERLAKMIARQSSQAQFVVVSLRRPMLENASHAIGVSLRADGFSKAIGLSQSDTQVAKELKEDKVSA